MKIAVNRISAAVSSLATLLAIIVLLSMSAPVAGHEDASKPVARSYKSDAGALKVKTISQEWKDSSRDRTLPVKIYYPEGDGPFPLIVVSHGLGGSREGLSYLSNHLASWGYVTIHPQHIGSDTPALRGGLEGARAAAANPQNAINRPNDVKFVIDEMLKLNDMEGELKGKIDPARVGIAGHSFGSFTVLASCGQVMVAPGGQRVTLTDERIRAGFAMSSPVQSRVDPKISYGTIAVPIFHMTGTNDNSPVGDTTPGQRRIPFDNSTRSDQYLITLTDGDHMIFGGRAARMGRNPRDAAHLAIIRQSAIAFFDAYLKEDAQAMQFLKDGGLKKAVGSDGVYELRAGTK